jgi:FAD dependent oxidoreductase
MTSKSLWMDIDVAPGAEVLEGVHECDVVVVGSGIAGVSTAYELCKRGKSVIVVDRGRICGGMTSRTSAHLAPLCDDLVSEMTKIKGHDATKLFCDSQAAAVDRIEEIQKSEKIDCDFRRLDGYLFQGRDMPADTSLWRCRKALVCQSAPAHWMTSRTPMRSSSLARTSGPQARGCCINCRRR